jgi:hypothetical protein
LEKTRIELRSAQKIIELQREDNLCYALCANASSSELRRSTGFHQFNYVLNKHNHIQKDKSDKIKELKSDIAELNHLLKYTIRQSVKEVISPEINTILAEIDSLYEITSEQMPMETKWTEIVTRRHKRNNSDRADNIYRIQVIKNRYKLPCDIEVNETQILNSTGNQESKKPYKTQASLRKKRHRIVIIGDSDGRECAPKISHNLLVDSDFEVQGIIKPNADLMAITNTVKEEIKFLTKNDVVGIWGGT